MRVLLVGGACLYVCRDVAVPPTVLCGGRHTRLPKRQLGTVAGKVPHPYPPQLDAPWMTHLLENNLWVARGRTRSQLHFDKENIVNCLFKGEKRWTLIDTVRAVTSQPIVFSGARPPPHLTLPDCLGLLGAQRTHATDMSWVRGGRYNTTDDFLNAGTDWVAVDTERVDLRMYPGLARARFTTLTQRAGDCIFVPYSMLHAVEKTDDGLGVAVSCVLIDRSHAPFLPLPSPSGPSLTVARFCYELTAKPSH